MADFEQITVTVPTAVIKQIDRCEQDRGKFVAEAIRNELERRQREDFLLSLRNPHPESVALAEQGLQEWMESLPQEDISELVDLKSGTPIRWIPGQGWVEEKE